jgi:hypothetical protein
MGGASDKIQGKVWVFLKNPSHLELVCGDGDNARMLTSPQWCVATIGVRIWWEFAFDLRILLIFVKSRQSPGSLASLEAERGDIKNSSRRWRFRG